MNHYEQVLTVASFASPGLLEQALLVVCKKDMVLWWSARADCRFMVQLCAAQVHKGYAIINN